MGIIYEISRWYAQAQTAFGAKRVGWRRPIWTLWRQTWIWIT